MEIPQIVGALILSAVIGLVIKAATDHKRIRSERLNRVIQRMANDEEQDADDEVHFLPE